MLHYLAKYAVVIIYTPFYSLFDIYKSLNRVEWNGVEWSGENKYYTIIIIATSYCIDTYCLLC